MERLSGYVGSAGWVHRDAVIVCKHGDRATSRNAVYRPGASVMGDIVCENTDEDCGTAGVAVEALLGAASEAARYTEVEELGLSLTPSRAYPCRPQRLRGRTSAYLIGLSSRFELVYARAATEAVYCAHWTN